MCPSMRDKHQLNTWKAPGSAGPQSEKQPIERMGAPHPAPEVCLLPLLNIKKRVDSGKGDQEEEGGL